MKTYIEVLISADGEKASLISEKLFDMGLKPSFGEHDFVYNWKDEVVLPEVLNFADRIQSKLKGTGAILKFTTIR
ncbi:MAG: hypothetical protein KAS76_02585 [Thermoplasmatales archaeon]|nr:hypothetical protein [Thermoplasmatales archaeon]MCK5636671.1 hypothetical protein [Thermoplasmatales archaeon]